jgi:hypothetical protein
VLAATPARNDRAAWTPALPGAAAFLLAHRTGRDVSGNEAPVGTQDRGREINGIDERRKQPVKGGAIDVAEKGAAAHILNGVVCPAVVILGYRVHTLHLVLQLA